MIWFDTWFNDYLCLRNLTCIRVICNNNVRDRIKRASLKLALTENQHHDVIIVYYNRINYISRQFVLRKEVIRRQFCQFSPCRVQTIKYHINYTMAYVSISIIKKIKKKPTMTSYFTTTRRYGKTDVRRLRKEIKAPINDYFTCGQSVKDKFALLFTRRKNNYRKRARFTCSRPIVWLKIMKIAMARVVYTTVFKTYSFSFFTVKTDAFGFFPESLSCREDYVFSYFFVLPPKECPVAYRVFFFFQTEIFVFFSRRNFVLVVSQWIFDETYSHEFA